MEPLDLRAQPPRSPRAQLEGVTFLPRTIDKARASLPGGNLGAYRLGGFSTTMVESVGIEMAAFVAAVADAPSEAAFLVWWREHASADGCAAWNEHVEHMPPAGGDRELANARYPWYADQPDLPTQIDVLIEDDRRAYAATT